MTLVDIHRQFLDAENLVACGRADPLHSVSRSSAAGHDDSCRCGDWDVAASDPGGG
jgi:hypothetical protein